MKRKILIFILISVMTASMIACSSNAAMPDKSEGKGQENVKPAGINIEKALSELGASMEMRSNRFYWAPDGKFALFNVTTSSTEIIALYDVKNNNLTKLAEGYLMPWISWSKGDKLVAFGTDSQLSLYNTTDNTLGKIADHGFMPQFSPDDSKFIYMNEGLWVYNLADKKSTQITRGKYDTSPIWFSDSKRVFYFRDNGKNLGDGAGNAQIMSILDTTEANKYTDIALEASNKYRSARWLKQDKSLYVYAGWDDGSSYHILDLENGKIFKDIAPRDSFSSVIFNDMDQKLYVTSFDPANGNVTAYDYNGKKLGVYNIDNDKSYPEAVQNQGINALKDNCIIYLHTDGVKGALMISNLADGKQTRITDYGDYSIPYVSPNGELLAYFEGGSKLKVVSADQLKGTEVAKIENGQKAYNELIRMLPNRVGAEWKYNGFAEYGHSMKIDGINSLGADKTEYLLSGKVDDMSDGESKGDFSIYLKYLVSNEGIKETIVKGEKMPHKIKEFDILRYPLVKGNTWSQQVEINGQSTELRAEIIEAGMSQDNNKTLKVQYTAKVSGMPNDTYKEVRTFEEGKGLIAFENTFDKDIDFGYSLHQFNK